jgi:hypothetical protein
MRLRLLAVAGTLTLALAAPSAALAHHGRGHRHHRHQAVGHHAKFKVLNINPGATSKSSDTPAPGATSPTAPSEENAATVVSYEKEVLTLKLKDGSTVSGKVSADTHIVCTGPMANPGEPGGQDDRREGDDRGQGDDQNRGDTSQSGGGWQEREDSDDDDAPGVAPEPPCDTSALVAGALVREAQLRIGPSGSEFTCVVVVRSS